MIIFNNIKYCITINQSRKRNDIIQTQDLGLKDFNHIIININKDTLNMQTDVF